MNNNNLINEERQYLGKVINTILNNYLLTELKPFVSIKQIKDKIEFWIKEFGVNSIKNFFIDGDYISVPVHISVENVLCHGMTDDDYLLQEGELIRIDLVVFRNGLYADSARTFCVGTPNEEQQNLLKGTKACVDNVISRVRAGDYISKIAKIITDTANEYNLFLAPWQLSGHAIGEKLHMEPTVLNFYHESYFKQNDVIIKPGMVLCIEPILSTIKIEKIYEDKLKQIISKNCPGYISHYEQMVQFEISENIVYT